MENNISLILFAMKLNTVVNLTLLTRPTLIEMDHLCIALMEIELFSQVIYLKTLTSVLASKAHTNYVMCACYIDFCTVVSQKCTTIFCLLVRKLFMVPQLIFQVKTIVTAKKE